MDSDAQTLRIAEDVYDSHTGELQTSVSLMRRRQTTFSDPHNKYQSQHLESVEEDTAAASDVEAEIVSVLGRRTRSIHKADPQAQIVLDLQKRIQALERQFKNVADGVHNGDDSSSLLKHSPQLERGTAIDQGDADGNGDCKPHQLITELHETTWAEFMNKFEDEKGEYIIEILTGDPVSKKKVLEEKPVNKLLHYGIPPESEATESTRSSPLPVPKHSITPNRIRINSPQILSQLGAIDRAIDPSQPLVMRRPFKFLVHYEDRIRQIVGRLRDELHAEPQTSTPRSSDDNEETLQHMECLIQFMDQYIKPTISRLKSDSVERISFRDLWYIFQPGEDIFMPLQDRQHHVSFDHLNVSPELLQGRYERMWRVIGVGGGRQNWSKAQDRDYRARQTPFKVYCYYIDFDGVHFCPIIHSFSIQPFAGERRIASLEFYPIRFLQQGTDVWQKSTTQCAMIFQAFLASHTHFYYRGPTLTTQPCGCPLPNDKVHQEHIESEVIVDYRTTLLEKPAWRPKPSFWKRPPSPPDELKENFRIKYWKDRTKSKLSRTEIDQIYDDNVIDKYRAEDFKNTTRIFDPVSSEWTGNHKSVPDTDIALIAPRVYVFVLRTRSFASVWLWCLEKISAQTELLQNLQLQNDSFKDTIHALVKTHFLQGSDLNHSENDYDVIRGKGKGLIFLLHGAPGVGKTFTAESVAAANGRPLFQITCGDLGLTPSEVESALKEIFRYAQLWNCVLLLDECDIFLTQRTKSDLKRNSLVSIFLKTLEYYRGVLFLTTNRVGTLDSAVKSRITWSAYYPPLNLKQTKEIWNANLNRLQKRSPNLEIDHKGIRKFAKRHFRRTSENGTNWNGRQIQNAFKVAVSLAEWDTLSREQHYTTDPDLVKHQAPRRLQLTISHFETVAKTADSFDEYLHEATGLTEEQRAYQAQERADNYPPDEEDTDEMERLDLLSPPLKRPRTSSMTSATQQAPQSTMHPNRRSSNPVQSQESPGIRRSSSHQQTAVPPKSRSNGGQLKSPNPHLSAPGPMNAQSPPPYERNTINKRKRSMNDHASSLHQSPPLRPQHPADDDSESDSDDEEMDNLINVETPSDMDER